MKKIFLREILSFFALPTWQLMMNKQCWCRLTAIVQLKKQCSTPKVLVANHKKVQLKNGLYFWLHWQHRFWSKWRRLYPIIEEKLNFQLSSWWYFKEASSTKKSLNFGSANQLSVIQNLYRIRTMNLIDLMYTQCTTLLVTITTWVELWDRVNCSFKSNQILEFSIWFINGQ